MARPTVAGWLNGVLTVLLLLWPSTTLAEVTRVTITSKTVVADGHSFGASGPYEKLVGRIEFALAPDDPHNRRIVDLRHAPRGADGRVHFSSDLYVIRPVDAGKGNGVLLFEVVNRGNKGLLARFNRDVTRSDDPTTLAHFGDGFLMREGYTLVFVGWEFGLAAPEMTITAPAARLPADAALDPIHVDIIVNARATEAYLVDEPTRAPVAYPPADLAAAGDQLTVRDRFWDEPVVVPRERWRFVPDAEGIPRVHLDGGFDPGRWYRVTYRATRPVVAGVGLAAIRDAASAFRYRSDLPIHGRATYAFGNSQTGRFLRLFLYQGFNADERNRRVFDAVWVHIAGAARGNFNSRFAAPDHGDMFESTQFPFADAAERDIDGARDGLLSAYRKNQRPKVFYTNTPVEYWGGGRAAALTHTSVDGTRDLAIPDDVRLYFLAGTQHIVGPMPPATELPAGAPAALARNVLGQELSNPTPQITIMRGLLRALHLWVTRGVAPPPSRYPRLGDRTLVRVQDVRFPAVPGVANPRSIVGPARTIGSTVTPLPHLVPQVDADGNDLGGVRDPEAAVPLATTTGWNFRRESVGNTGDIYQTLGSYIPFPRTRALREMRGDPRTSIEERYSSLADYVQRVRAAAIELIRQRYMLTEDLDAVLARATSHWAYATGAPAPRPDAGR